MPGSVWEIGRFSPKKYSKSGAMLPTTIAENTRPLRRSGRTAAGCASVKGIDVIVTRLTASRFSPQPTKGQGTPVSTGFCWSHAVIVRTATAFGWDPGDDFVGIHDVAGLAMDAVRRVQMNLLAIGNVGRFHHLVNIRRAEVLAWIAVLGNAPRVADVRV